MSEVKAITRRTALAGIFAASQAPVILRGQNLNSELRLGLIGAGSRGCGAVRQALDVSEKVRLVSVCDAFPERLGKERVVDNGTPVSYLSRIYEELEKKNRLDQVDIPDHSFFTGINGYQSVIDECDAVILAAPTGFRSEHFAEAVGKGVHAFLEAPLGTDVPGCSKIRESNRLAKEKQLKCLVGFFTRRSKAYRDTFEKVKDEKLVGSIQSGNLSILLSGEWPTPAEAGWTEMEYQLRNWEHFPWLSLEKNLAQCVEAIDYTLRLIGEVPLQATSEGGFIRTEDAEESRGPSPSLDYIYSDFDFPGGAKIRNEGRWVKGMRMVRKESYVAEGGSFDAGYRTEIVDQSGNMVWKRNHVAGRDPSPFEYQMKVWIDSIIEGTEMNDVDSAVDATLAAILARTAAYHQRTVTWDEMLTMNERFVPESVDWDSPPLTRNQAGEYSIPPQPIS